VYHRPRAKTFKWLLCHFADSNRSSISFFLPFRHRVYAGSVDPFVRKRSDEGYCRREKEVENNGRSIGGDGMSAPNYDLSGAFEPSTGRDNIWGHDELRFILDIAVAP
jgi:hypothetical protein